MAEILFIKPLKVVINVKYMSMQIVFKVKSFVSVLEQRDGDFFSGLLKSWHSP